MNIRIMLGTGLLLTVGTAVAGTLLYGQGAPMTTDVVSPVALSDASTVTPEMLAAWAADTSDNYVAPKVPI